MAVETVALAALPHRTRAEVLIDAATSTRRVASQVRVLSHPQLLVDPRVWRHAYATRTPHLQVWRFAGVDYSRVRSEPSWPTALRTLLRVAAVLSGTDPITVDARDLIVLDETSYRVFLSAWAIRRGDATWPAAASAEIRDVCATLAGPIGARR